MKLLQDFFKILPDFFQKVLEKFAPLVFCCDFREKNYRHKARMTTEVDDFLSYMAADRGCSPCTTDAYGATLTAFARYCQGIDEQITWQSIDADIIRRWMADRMATGLNARSMARDLAALRSFFKYLLRMNLAQHDPTRLVRNPKKHVPLPAFLKQEEVDRLFDEITFPSTPEGQRDRNILLTFYHTGIRLSELTGLTIASIDLARAELSVIGKRNKQRIVPFGSELRESLAAYIARRKEEGATISSPLFPNKNGQRMRSETVRQVVKQYLSLVTTQKKRSPHVLRHTFATAMLNNGAGLEAIKELLGHESITTTEVYTHATFADLKKEYEHAHPRA